MSDEIEALDEGVCKHDIRFMTVQEVISNLGNMFTHGYSMVGMTLHKDGKSVTAMCGGVYPKEGQKDMCELMKSKIGEELDQYIYKDGGEYKDSYDDMGDIEGNAGVLA